jgi:hypothetical protein
VRRREKLDAFFAKAVAIPLSEQALLRSIAKENFGSMRNTERPEASPSATPGS